MKRLLPKGVDAYFCHLRKLEKIQNRAIRFIKKDYRSRERWCITKMRKEIELEKLVERRQSLRLVLMYKMVEGLVPALPTDAFVTSEH